MTVSGLHRRSIQNEDGEEQAEPARYGSAPILEYADQHACQDRLC